MLLSISNLRDFSAASKYDTCSTDDQRVTPLICSAKYLYAVSPTCLMKGGICYSNLWCQPWKIICPLSNLTIVNILANSFIYTTILTNTPCHEHSINKTNKHHVSEIRNTPQVGLNISTTACFALRVNKNMTIYKGLIAWMSEIIFTEVQL
jgi:hypothetical protein